MHVLAMFSDTVFKKLLMLCYFVSMIGARSHHAVLHTNRSNREGRGRHSAQGRAPRGCTRRFVEIQLIIRLYAAYVDIVAAQRLTHEKNTAMIDMILHSRLLISRTYDVSMRSYGVSIYAFITCNVC